VTIKETLRIIQVYDFNCPTLLIKSLQRMRLRVKVKKYSCLLSSFINTSLLQRIRSEGKEPLSNTLSNVQDHTDARRFITQKLVQKRDSHQILGAAGPWLQL
jgi:hypothetical protein